MASKHFYLKAIRWFYWFIQFWTGLSLSHLGLFHFSCHQTRGIKCYEFLWWLEEKTLHLCSLGSTSERESLIFLVFMKLNFSWLNCCTFLYKVSKQTITGLWKERGYCEPYFISRLYIFLYIFWCTRPSFVSFKIPSALDWRGQKKFLKFIMTVKEISCDFLGTINGSV